jgi:competence protein ComEC
VLNNHLQFYYIVVILTLFSISACSPVSHDLNNSDASTDSDIINDIDIVDGGDANIDADIDADADSSIEPPPEVTITIINVGQGNATLISAPTGQNLLFDTGRKVDDGLHIGDILWGSPSDLTTVIISHYDSDHMGSLDRIISGPDNAPGISGIDDDSNGTIDIRTEIGEYGSSASDDFIPFKVLDRGLDEIPETIDMQEYLASTNDVRSISIPGESIDLGVEDFKIEVVAVDGDLIGDLYVPPGYENDRSVALLISYNGFHMLILSDLPKYVEVLLADQLAIRGIDLNIMHVGHHGSYTSTDSETLALLTPEIAVISVGNSPSCGPGYNFYGHPSQDTLEALNNGGVEMVVQTEEGGASMESGTCNPESGQSWPRDYFSMEKVFSNGDFTIKTDGTKYTINVRGESYEFPID